ncbi:MAG: hypothetical protein JW909_04165 [Planctomycetes bacterium]|nr:hypothetical protein [Planctomycetota bacterium]
MQYAIILGIWVPLITVSLGRLTVPQEFEAAWCFLLIGAALAAAILDSERAGLRMAAEAAVISIFVTVLLALGGGVVSRWAGMMVLYGRLAGYCLLLTANYMTRFYGKETGAGGRTAMVALVLTVDVVFVLAAGEIGPAAALCAVPGIAIALGPGLQKAVRFCGVAEGSGSPAGVGEPDE